MTLGTWRKVGFIERAGAGLTVHARAFGHEAVGTIPPEQIKRLIEDRALAEIHDEKHGRIGSAVRSRSGRGVIIHLLGAPEASGSWAGLQDLLSGFRDKVILSVLEEVNLIGENEGGDDPELRGGVLDHGSLDLRAGLSTRF
jgi:hypothetical protein